jgi:protein gp37
MVFVNSMSDLFHPKVPDKFIRDLFEVMTHASRHTFQILTKRPQRAASLLTSELPGHIWIGTSIENDSFVFRANHLRRINVPIRFLSCEPMLGPLPSVDLSGISWVIVGGESGPGHRPMKIEWVREIRDKVVEAEVAFFFKQWGGHTSKAGGRQLDGVEWSQWPQTTIDESDTA